MGAADPGAFRGVHRLEGASSVFGCFHNTYKKVQAVAIDPMTAKISEPCMPQPTLHGRRKLFRCLPKRRCWCFRCVVKPLCPLRPLRRGLPRPQSGFLVFRAECGYVDLFLQIFLLLEHFVDFCGQTVQRGWLLCWIGGFLCILSNFVQPRCPNAISFWDAFGGLFAPQRGNSWNSLVALGIPIYF